MLIGCGAAGASGSSGALYHAGDTSTAGSEVDETTVGVGCPSKSPNGLDGALVT